MKLYIAAALCLFVALGSAADLDKCARGESYWCSDLQVAKTCGAFKHCMYTVWKNQKLTQDGGEVCEFCEAILDDVRRLIADNRTKDDVARFLESACGVIPDDSIAATCRFVVMELMPEVMEMLSENVNPQVICGTIKMCKGLADKTLHNEVPSRQIPARVPKTSVGSFQGPDYCGDCKKFFTDLKIMLRDKTEQEMLEQFLEHDVCVFFGFMSKKCQEMVKALLPLYLEYITQFDDPNMICHLIRFCTEDVQRPVNQHMLTLLEQFRNAKNGSECETCKAIVEEVQSLAQNPAIQKEIVDYLKTDVCKYFGKSKDQCSMAVEKFAPTVFKFLSTWLDPDARCRGFGFCPSSRLSASSVSSVNNIHKDAAKIPSLKPHEVSNQNECALCELVLNAIKSMLAKNATEEEIIEGLDKVCSMLPGTLNATCKDFVNEYVPAILAMLRQEVDPEQVCALLGLCSSKLGTFNKLVTAQGKSGDTCFVCKAVVQYIQALLEDKSSLSEIEKLMKKVCNFLPDSMKSQCVDIVDTYGALIAHMIATEYTPEQICKVIKLCSSETAEVPMIALEPGIPKN